MTEATNTTNEYGELIEDEKKELEAIRRDHEAIVREIGVLEIRKTRLLVIVGEMENRAQDTLAGVAKRLNIPQGQAWHVDAEGKAKPGMGGR